MSEGFLQRAQRRLFTSGQESPDSKFAGISDEDRAIIERCLPHTMTGVRRLFALMESVRYTVDAGIPGAYVECGVWRGGSVLAMIAVMTDKGIMNRDIFMFDTFTGMTKPSDRDVSNFQEDASEAWEKATKRRERAWPAMFGPTAFSLDDLRETIAATGYPQERLHFIEGDVLDTLPEKAPRSISLLRLDTDWYESTLHELRTLYPLLSPGGVLVIDDYGHWEGCKQAVDEYFGAQRPLLTPVDYACRVATKPTDSEAI